MQPTCRLRTLLSLGLAIVAVNWAPPAFSQQTKKAARIAAPAPSATAIDRLKAAKGFKVELLYTVPREEQGSWVSLATDPKGRLIASDQYGKLFRITPPPVGNPTATIKVEPINVAIGEAQGLLWAFDSLYVMVNAGGKFKSGLYLVRDTNGDDQLDKVEMLRELRGGGEHGPHGIALAPDGKSLYVVAGNATALPELSSSLVPRVWGEDNLLSRMTDGNGFMRDEKAPGGYICRVDPDGKSWELVSMGMRNAYDLAFNKDGELFTYDSDMEWDMNTPWYRPTRVLHAVSGADFGYRNGAGKWPTYYFDSLPPVVNIGPGSPTGVAFGYGAKFPAKYQDAFFSSDWSYGKLYAVHLKPKGATYGADVEEFITGSPLPLTDVVVNPTDGALYFAIGGRKTTSGLYRVTYSGNESTASTTATQATLQVRLGNNPVQSVTVDRAEGTRPADRSVRHVLEAFHGHADPKAVETCWPFLSNPDRWIRYAARVAIEFQAPATWRDKALTETDPQASLEALLALVQVTAQDPAHRKPGDAVPPPAFQNQVLGALDRLPLDALSLQQRLDLIRLVSILFNRTGRPSDEVNTRIVAKLGPWYPSKVRELNVELGNLLAYLGAPGIAEKTVALLNGAPTQEEQLEYARILRTLKSGWTPELRMAYFAWFPKAASFKGGSSFRGFLMNIHRDAVATLSHADKAGLGPFIQPPAPATAAKVNTVARPFVKSWTLDELVPIVDGGLKEHRDFDRGRSLFAAANCFACHRFADEGGSAGPDLTGVSGRFSTRDLLESMVVPSKVISDQYAAIVVETTDGRVVAGRVVNLSGDNMSINTDMLDPNAQVNVDRRKIEEIKPSPVSMMPEGLLNTFKADEIADLVAYLLSRGDRDQPMFR